MTVTVQLTWDDGADQSLCLPSYETAGAAGADLRANLVDRKTITLAPGARALIPTARPVGTCIVTVGSNFTVCGALRADCVFCLISDKLFGICCKGEIRHGHVQPNG